MLHLCSQIILVSVSEVCSFWVDTKKIISRRCWMSLLVCGGGIMEDFITHHIFFHFIGLLKIYNNIKL